MHNRAAYAYEWMRVNQTDARILSIVLSSSAGARAYTG